MSRKVFAVVLVFLCFAPIALVQASSMNGEATPAYTDRELPLSGPATRSLTPHYPIYINGNSQFTEANGVSAAGNGTEGNPYIIEDWNISASSANGIDIRNTDAYFIIRNCVIHDGLSANKFGIYFISVQNCKIDNVTSYNNKRGFRVDYSSNNQITNCSIYDNEFNIILSDSSSNSLINCDAYNGGVGIFLDHSPSIITDCRVHDNFYGFEICESPSSIITNCTVYGNSYGIYILLSNGNSICHNNFINNTQNACDEGFNYWNNGEGNYWSDYIGYDTNGDGIGDDPYYIPGGSNKDNYPLMFPYPTKRNLKVTNLTLKSTIQGLRIAANVTNDGITDLTNVTIGFYVNQTNISEQKKDISKNTTQTIFTHWQAQVGKYTIKVKADSGDLVKEINELDNEVSTYIELSDVAVATEDITAAVVQNGIQINVTLHNPGPVLIGAPTYTYIDSKLEHQELVGVPAQGSNNVSFVWNGPSGNHGVLVVVDPENLFIEADETNNNATKTIYMLTGAPDLSITSADIYFNPTSPIEGRNTTVTAIAHNIGYATSSTSTATITFYDNENIIYTTTLPAIEQGGQYPISTIFTAHDGHTIKVEITTTGIEYNLGNNYATAELNTVLPDLYIDNKNITITPSKPVEGGSASITAKIYNLGEGVGEATVQFFADSNLIGEKHTGEIPPGLSADVTIIWNNTTAGAIISVKILPAYPDAQSWNNEAETLLEETKTYILVPKNITFSPDPPIQNQSTTVSVEIWNTGEASSPNAVISFYDGIALISNESIGPIPTGEHLNVSTTWAHAQKERTVYVRIDISPHIVSKLLLTTRMPDLTVSNITFSERYPENNTTVLIYVTVKNQGTATSELAELKVYAGDTLLEVITIAPLPAGSSHREEISWRAQNLVRINAELTTSIDADAGNDFLALLSPETTYSTSTPQQPPIITMETGISLGGIITAIIVGLSLYFKREAVGNLIFVAIPLQLKTEKDALKTETRKKIYDCIKERGPSNPYQVQTSLLDAGMRRHYSTVVHEMEKLRGWKILSARKEGHATIYYLPEMYKQTLEVPSEIKTQIVDFVILKKDPTLEEIVKELASKHQISESDEELNNFYERIDRIVKDLVYKGILIRTFDENRAPHYKYAYPQM